MVEFHKPSKSEKEFVKSSTNYDHKNVNSIAYRQQGDFTIAMVKVKGTSKKMLRVGATKRNVGDIKNKGLGRKIALGRALCLRSKYEV